MEAAQKYKIEIIARAIKDNKYDVVAMQEVNQSITTCIAFENIKADNFALVVLNELKRIGCNDYKMIWDFSHIGFDIYEEGLVILTRHEIEDKKSIFISKNMDKNHWKTRIALRVSINIGKEIVDFYSCHLGWWNDEEEDFCKQADRLISSINKKRLTFLMGDFNNNANIRNEGYDYILSRGIFDTFNISEARDTGITVKGKIDGWEENKKDLRLDLILTNVKKTIKYSRVIFNGENREVVSDHYGVEICAE